MFDVLREVCSAFGLYLLIQQHAQYVGVCGVSKEFRQWAWFQV
jgi:hypothetical protein